MKKLTPEDLARFYEADSESLKDEQELSDYMKDVNLMVLAVSKDYLRLATDMQVLHRYLGELTKRIKRDEMESE